jgi:predicted nucleotidyltransferase
MIHDLHRTIGDIITAAFPEFEIVRDPACGGDTLVSLFCSRNKSRITKYADVDLAIIKDGKLRVIVEIEESGKNPAHIFGKFLASALSSYFIKECAVELDSVLFIQIIDTLKLKIKRSSKLKQFESIERSIQGVIPLKNSKITKYKLLCGDIEDFEKGDMREELIDCIQSHLLE